MRAFSLGRPIMGNHRGSSSSFVPRPCQKEASQVCGEYSGSEAHWGLAFQGLSMLPASLLQAGSRLLIQRLDELSARLGGQRISSGPGVGFGLPGPGCCMPSLAYPRAHP